MSKDHSKICELEIQIERIIGQQKALQRELEDQKVKQEIAFLTTKHHLDYQLLYNDEKDYNIDYQIKSNDLLNKGYMIRKTFKRGELELWMKSSLIHTT